VRKTRYFGTDGIRGRVGDSPITPDFMLKLGWAVGTVLKKGSTDPVKVLIGKDTRISGYMFESALEAGLVAAGVNIELLGPMPTPAIAYLTRTLRASLGIVISASHNPYEDNGIKFFSNRGLKLDDKMELAIEAAFDEPMQVVSPEQLGKAMRVEDAGGRYIEFCKSRVSKTLSLKGLKIVLDCANGATYHVAPPVFEELGADVIEMAVEPNGMNINLDCGATNLATLKNKVLESKADLGIALDGDGDRVMMIDHNGETVDGDELVYIIAQEMHRRGKLKGGVVGTLMSNLGLELAIEAMGFEFIRANVGDRYVMQALKEKGWTLGGESSGHIVMLDKSTTGDGIVSALHVVQAMINQKKPLTDLKASMRKCPQVLINVPVKDKSAVANNETVKTAVKAAEAAFSGKGRVLLRPSGTESLVRVMVEGEDTKAVNEAAQALAKIVKTALA
jgi:phosphoglucosamine mutase